jgi:hypothetical protein
MVPCLFVGVKTLTKTGAKNEEKLQQPTTVIYKEDYRLMISNQQYICNPFSAATRPRIYVSVYSPRTLCAFCKNYGKYHRRFSGVYKRYGRIVED